jgi:hypothetical protein
MKEGRSSQEPLAEWTDQVLRQVPARRAPASLAPRILQAIARQRALPWYRRPWMEWPRLYQVITAVATLLILGAGGWWILPHADAVSLSAATEAASQLEAVREVSVTAGVLKSLGQALLLVVRSLHAWVLAALLGLAALIWTTTLGLGTVCWRIAAGPR